MITEFMAPGQFPPIVAILGPTATGKSRLAMQLARRFPIEIISADSRQVYRRLDIGTAKPTASEQAAVRHHLIDLIDPDGWYSVADFVRDAHQSLAGIASRNRIALVVGGSGQYARALLQGQTMPPVDVDPKLRAQVETFVRKEGVERAVERIRRLDGTTAKRLDVRNPRRVARALEILEATGQPIPPVQSQPLPALILGLGCERKQLYGWADRRVEAQVATGLIEETRHVLELGYSAELPVMRGLAYGQMIAHIEGRTSRHEAIEAYKHATHRLIRRHTTWFRKEPRLEWLEAASPRLVDEVSDRVDAHLAGTRVAPGREPR